MGQGELRRRAPSCGGVLPVDGCPREPGGYGGRVGVALHPLDRGGDRPGPWLEVCDCDRRRRDQGGERSHVWAHRAVSVPSGWTRRGPNGATVHLAVPVRECLWATQRPRGQTETVDGGDPGLRGDRGLRRNMLDRDS
ncbi:hypothetical protein WJX73_004446 [Symbiochloris irregularis]|uniref:Uncharacterized protein n=1 Tax=Symbiochloris irregularis TaxID=706552 RepID=A0AAW1NPH6_9CHLO